MSRFVVALILKQVTFAETGHLSDFLFSHFGAPCMSQNMGIHGITRSGAELLATVLEALLYGFSLLMFGGITWMVSQRSSVRMNHKMFAAACALLFFSTVHLVIDTIRVMQGFVSYQDDLPDGPEKYFMRVSQWTFVWKSYVYTAQTLVGDGVILYRCYVVWQSKLIMILPTLLYCSVAVTGFACPSIAWQTTENDIYGWWLWKWITSFYASTLSTCLLTTFLLACRIWHVDRKTKNLRGGRRSRVRPVLQVILDAGMIYSFTLVAALICLSVRTNGQYVILNMVTPIISITFYMVIIRVAMANQPDQSAHTTPPRCSVTGNGLIVDRGRRMEVHVTKLTELKSDDGHRSPTTAISDENSRKDSALGDDIECAV